MLEEPLFIRWMGTLERPAQGFMPHRQGKGRVEITMVMAAVRMISKMNWT